jgi:hypothetical protein
MFEVLGKIANAVLACAMLLFLPPLWIKSYPIQGFSYFLIKSIEWAVQNVKPYLTFMAAQFSIPNVAMLAAFITVMLLCYRLKNDSHVRYGFFWSLSIVWVLCAFPYKVKFLLQNSSLVQQILLGLYKMLAAKSVQLLIFSGITLFAGVAFIRIFYKALINSDVADIRMGYKFLCYQGFMYFCLLLEILGVVSMNYAVGIALCWLALSTCVLCFVKFCNNRLQDELLLIILLAILTPTVIFPSLSLPTAAKLFPLLWPTVPLLFATSFIGMRCFFAQDDRQRGLWVPCKTALMVAVFLPAILYQVENLLNVMHWQQTLHIGIPMHLIAVASSMLLVMLYFSPKRFSEVGQIVMQLICGPMDAASQVSNLVVKPLDEKKVAASLLAAAAAAAAEERDEDFTADSSNHSEEEHDDLNVGHRVV